MGTVATGDSDSLPAASESARGAASFRESGITGTDPGLKGWMDAGTVLRIFAFEDAGSIDIKSKRDAAAQSSPIWAVMG